MKQKLYKKVRPYGKIYDGSREYLLLRPVPIELDSWLQKDVGQQAWLVTPDKPNHSDFTWYPASMVLVGYLLSVEIFDYPIEIRIETDETVDEKDIPGESDSDPFSGLFDWVQELNS